MSEKQIISKKQTNPNQRPQNWKPLDLRTTESNVKKYISTITKNSTPKQQLDVVNKIVAEYITALYGKAELDDKTQKTTQLITDKVKAEISSLLTSYNNVSNTENEKNQEQILVILSDIVKKIDSQKNQFTNATNNSTNNGSTTSTPNIINAENVSTIKNTLSTTNSKTTSKKESINEFTQKSSPTYKEIAKYVNITQQYISNISKKIVNKIKDVYNGIVKTMKTIIGFTYNAISSVLKGIKNLIVTGFKQITKFIKKISTLIKNISAVVYKALVSVTIGLFSTVKNIFLHPIQTLKSAIIGIGKLTLFGIKAIMVTVKLIFGAVLFIGKIVFKVAAFIFKVIWKAISFVFKTLWTITKIIGKILINTLAVIAKTTLMLAMFAAFKLIFEPIATFLNLLIAALIFRAFGDRIFKGLFAGIKSILDTIIDAIKSLFGFGKDATMDFYKWIKDNVIIPFARWAFDDDSIGTEGGKTVSQKIGELLPTWLKDAFNAMGDFWKEHVAEPIREMLGIPKGVSYSEYFALKLKLLMGIPPNKSFFEHIGDFFSLMTNFVTDSIKIFLEGGSQEQYQINKKGLSEQLSALTSAGKVTEELHKKIASEYKATNGRYSKTEEMLKSIDPKQTLSYALSQFKVPGLEAQREAIQGVVQRYAGLQSNIGYFFLHQIDRMRRDEFGNEDPEKTKRVFTDIAFAFDKNNNPQHPTLRDHLNQYASKNMPKRAALLNKLMRWPYKTITDEFDGDVSKAHKWLNDMALDCNQICGYKHWSDHLEAIYRSYYIVSKEMAEWLAFNYLKNQKQFTQDKQYNEKYKIEDAIPTYSYDFWGNQSTRAIDDWYGKIVKPSNVKQKFNPTYEDWKEGFDKTPLGQYYAMMVKRFGVTPNNGNIPEVKIDTPNSTSANVSTSQNSNNMEEIKNACEAAANTAEVLQRNINIIAEQVKQSAEGKSSSPTQMENIK